MANFIDETAIISNKVVIDISSKGTNTIIGKKTVIDDFVKIKHVGGVGDVVIGDNVYINSCTVIYSGNGVKIGDFTAIGPNCSIVPVNHNFIDKNIIIQAQGFAISKGGIIIEDDVWIGAGVTILDGSHIKKGSVIGACSLVNGFIEEYSINIGIPTKCIGFRK